MVERVVLGGWPGFSLPDLGPVVEGATVVAVDETVIDVRHHDTSDRRLAGDGIAVVRSGDGWRVDLPGDRAISVAGDASPGLDALLAAYLRGERLEEVAHVRTRSRGLALVDGGGRSVGRVVDDEVSVVHGDRVAARFRELLIEVDSGAVATSVERALRQAGATDPDPLPRLARALGAGLDLADPVGPSSSAAELVREQLVALRRRWLRHDVLLRDGSLGPGRYAGPPARLRALVRAVRPLVERDWADALDAVVAPVDCLAQRAAGAARRRAFLDAAVARLAPADRQVADRFVERAELAARRALDHLLDELDSPSYLETVEQVVRATRRPAFAPDAGGAGVVLLPRLAAEHFGSWRRTADVLDPSDVDRLERTTARLDRVAAVAATAAPALPEAMRHAVRLRAAAKVLMDALVLHDTGVWLQGAVDRGASRRQAFVAGVLTGALDHDRVDLADAWPEVWWRASRRRVRAWLSP